MLVQVFTAIFATEAALKIMALGLFRYLKDRWNCFDLFVVSLSLIELGLSGNKAFSILRSFRLVCCKSCNSQQSYGCFCCMYRCAMTFSIKKIQQNFEILKALFLKFSLKFYAIAYKWRNNEICNKIISKRIDLIYVTEIQ